MKKILTVLMAAALVCAFAMPAAASDMKVSGSYYAEGMFEDNTDLGENGTSHAITFQRLRIQPEFLVEEGLKVVARLDVMERRWGEATSTVAADDDNLSWERAYVDFNTGIGNFAVGYQTNGAWGTSFCDSTGSAPRVKYTKAFGPVTMLAVWEKEDENDIVNPTQADSDQDAYSISPIYAWESGQAGVLFKYYSHADLSGATATPDTGYKGQYYLVAPYVKATFGPVAVEAELDYMMGDAVKYEQSSATRQDIGAEGYSYYVKATANLGPASVGGQFAFVSGDDTTTNDSEAGPAGGQDYNPFLILYNDDTDKWMGTPGTIADYNGDELTNGYLWQVFGTVSPMEKLSIWAAFGGAVADKATTATQTYLNDDIGYEFDVTATYKIYNNLEYKVGFGYLWTGDWWKGNSAATKIDNDYVVLHKLSVTF